MRCAKGLGWHVRNTSLAAPTLLLPGAELSAARSRLKALTGVLPTIQFQGRSAGLLDMPFEHCRP